MRYILLALTFVLAACGSDKPIAFSCPRFEEFRIPVPVTPNGAVRGAVAPLLDSRLDSALGKPGSVGAVDGARAAQPDSVLLLSGGGKWGAWGAGFLDAWSDAPQAELPRPQFRIVTGISTGALQSTFAFIGPEADADLVAAYSIEREAQLARRHGKLFFLGHGSMASLEPLVGYARARAEPWFDRVAEEHDKGRVLLVGVVDALDGNLYAVDLTRIAADLSGKERSDCYIGALLASAAIPVVFTQVRINDRPYFDGGVRQSVFVTGIQQALGRVTGEQQGKSNLFVLMNGVPGAGTVSEVKPDVLSPLGRLRAITFDQVEQASVYAVSQSAPSLTTWVTTAEGHGCADPHSSDEDIFNPQFMTCLIAAGRAKGAEDDRWTLYSQS